MKRRALLAIAIALLTAAVAVGAGPEPVDAQESTVLRIATLATRGSPWDRAFRAWGNSVRQQTNGRLRLQFYVGGAQGDERDYIRKMESGQLDGAAITTNGLGQIARPVLVLSAPGLFTEYAQIDRARRAMNDELMSEFDRAGYKFMGWGDVGRARFFSKRRVARPSDLRQTRPWTRGDDAILNQFYSAVGVRPQRLGVNELLPGLQTGRVDAFPAPALVAVSFQWFHHAQYVTQQANSVVIGATVIKKERFEALPEDLRAVLESTGVRAHGALLRSIRSADDRAYATLTSRGVEAVDTTPHQAEWQRVADTARQALAGRLFPPDLLRKAERYGR